MVVLDLNDYLVCTILFVQHQDKLDVRVDELVNLLSPLIVEKTLLNTLVHLLNL